MALKMQRGCQWWYCRYKVHGKERTVPLNVKIEGKRPKRLREMGDREFELSRAKAQIAADEFLESMQTRQRKENLLKEIYKIQSGGEEFPEHLLSNIYNVWLGMAERTESRSVAVKAQIEKFVSFMKKKYPRVLYAHEVTQAHAKAFLETEAIQKLAPATYNGLLGILKVCMKETGSDAFEKIARRSQKNQVHRVPFTEEELVLIRKEAEADPFIRPVIIIAMCSGMRIGDCCSIKWSDIDEPEGVIRVKTSKTNTSVVVPLFDWLKDELARHERQEGSEYILPRQRYRHMADSSFFNKRLKKILIRLGFGAQPERYRLQSNMVPFEDVDEQVFEYFSTMPDTTRSLKVRNVYSIYQNGASVDEISHQLSISKSTVSLYLNEIEDMAKVRFIRGKCRTSDGDGKSEKPIAVKPDGGLKYISIRGFHAFRTTWVTLALQAGVPIETVRLVTGHKTVEVVIEHYFNPSQRDIRDALKAAMPFSDSQKEAA